MNVPTANTILAAQLTFSNTGTLDEERDNAAPESPPDNEEPAQEADASPQDSTGPPEPPKTPLEAAYWATVEDEPHPDYPGIRIIRPDINRYNAHFGEYAYGRDYDLIVEGINLLLAWKVSHHFDQNGPTIPFEELVAEADDSGGRPDVEANEHPFWVDVAKHIPPRPKTQDLWTLWNRTARPIADRMWQEQTGETKSGRPLASFTTDDLLTHTFEVRDDIIAGLIPSTGLRATIANAKVGKTAFGMQQAICVGAGIPFMGRETQQGRVLFIEEEGAPAALQYRLRRMIEAMEHDLHREIRPETEWLLRQQTEIASDEGIERIRRKIEETKPRLVVWGPLSMIGHLTNENDAAEMQKAMRALLAMAADYDIAIDVAHHRRKVSRDNNPNGVSEWFDTIRGSSALLGAVDTAVGLDRKVEDEYGRLFIISRDGPSQIAGYRFDPNTLLHYPEDTIPKVEEKAPLLVVRDLLRNKGRLTIKEVETAFEVTQHTAASRLEELVQKEWAYRTEEGGRKTRVYIPRNYEQQPLPQADTRPVSERLADIFEDPK